MREAQDPERTSRLSIEGLHVDRAGRPVVRGVDIDVAAGEITGLLGANGAGKSTLVLAIAGRLPIRAGTILTGSRSLVGLRPD
jgi:branched-chain amino acid transport system ATP-binding protein